MRARANGDSPDLAAWVVVTRRRAGLSLAADAVPPSAGWPARPVSEFAPQTAIYRSRNRHCQGSARIRRSRLTLRW